MLRGNPGDLQLGGNLTGRHSSSSFFYIIMADNKSKLRFVTYNCRSVKNSVNDVKLLCLDHDIICLQEHWLLPFELDFFIKYQR